MAFNLPGAPNLLNPPSGRTVITAVLGRVAGALWDFLFPGPVWGIMNNDFTKDEIKVDSIVSVGLRRESSVSDYKIENGSFISYNKVSTPSLITLRLTQGGEEEDRTALLVWLKNNVEKPVYYGIRMPEGGLKNMTLVSYSLERTATSGLGLLIVDCVFQEIRELKPIYSKNNVAAAKNAPASPSQRVNARSSSRGGDVAW